MAHPHDRTPGATMPEYFSDDDADPVTPVGWRQHAVAEAAPEPALDVVDGAPVADGLTGYALRHPDGKPAGFVRWAGVQRGPVWGLLRSATVLASKADADAVVAVTAERTGIRATVVRVQWSGARGTWVPAWTEAEGQGSTPGGDPEGHRDGRASSVEGEDRETRSSPGDAVATGGGLETTAAPSPDRAEIEAAAPRAGVVWDTIVVGWVHPAGGLAAWEGLALPLDGRTCWWSCPVDADPLGDATSHATELAALLALPPASPPSSLGGTTSAEGPAFPPCPERLHLVDEANVWAKLVLHCGLPIGHAGPCTARWDRNAASWGGSKVSLHLSLDAPAWIVDPTVTVRRVTTPRAVDAFTNREVRTALERLANHHRRQTVADVLAVLDEVRRG